MKNGIIRSKIKKTLEEWKSEIETMQIFQQIDSLKYNLEIWKENAE